jgi:hypothetical protein
VVQFLVTNNTDFIPKNCQFFEVDGTIGNVPVQSGNYRWDHHRLGGSDCQIQEMPQPGNLLESLGDGREQIIATTSIDLDAVCAAVWLLLPPGIAKKNLKILEAISLYCDHLCIPHGYMFDTQVLDIAREQIDSFGAQMYVIRGAKSKLLKIDLQTNDPQELVQLNSSIFEKLVNTYVYRATSGNWKVSGIPNWITEKNEKNYSTLFEENSIITLHDGVCVFDLSSVNGFISNDFLFQKKIEAERKNEKPFAPLTLTIFRGKNNNIQLTMGSDARLASWKKVNFYNLKPHLDQLLGCNYEGRRTVFSTGRNFDATNANIDEVCNLMMQYAL